MVPVFSFSIGRAVEWTHKEIFLVKFGFDPDGLKIIHVHALSWFAIKVISNKLLRRVCRQLCPVWQVNENLLSEGRYYRPF